MHTVGLKCGSFAEGVRGWGWVVGIWVFELSPRTRLVSGDSILVASALQPKEETLTRITVPQLGPQTLIMALCAQTIIIIKLFTF